MSGFGKRPTGEILTLIEQPGKPAGSSQASPAIGQDADYIRDQVMLQIEPSHAVRMTKEELARFVNGLVSQIANEKKLLLNQAGQDSLSAEIVNEMIGLGPIEPLLADQTICDILVNGPDQIYVERHGKLELTPLKFRHDSHVLHVAQRIASSIGRTVDETTPMLDARLQDGSRVNIIIPPLALNGPSLSIRKFSRQMLSMSNLLAEGSMSPQVAEALEIFARCRLNIIVSGGTGSGKTTLLNALSAWIDRGERIVTIEDAAELQLQQQHVIRLETRPASVEGRGLIDQGQLVRNALRMRPDRIIVGESRGPEAFDMMQAMNTGHAGSMATVHANSARDAVARIENMILMGNANLPVSAIRTQIASAVDVIVHTERMHDGVRRVKEVVEVVGIENDVIVLAPLFKFQYRGMRPDGKIDGVVEATPIPPRFLSRTQYYGLDGALLETLGIQRLKKAVA
jgi:pilus assembly protein CpaF